MKPPEHPFNKERLKQAREFCGLSWSQLAAKAEINEAIIQAMEMGWHVPDVSELFRLCTVLRFPRAFFFQEDPPHFGWTSLDIHDQRSGRRRREEER